MRRPVQGSWVTHARTLAYSRKARQTDPGATSFVVKLPDCQGERSYVLSVLSAASPGAREWEARGQVAQHVQRCSDMKEHFHLGPQVMNGLMYQGEEFGCDHVQSVSTLAVHLSVTITVHN